MAEPEPEAELVAVMHTPPGFIGNLDAEQAAALDELRALAAPELSSDAGQRLSALLRGDDYRVPLSEAQEEHYARIFELSDHASSGRVRAYHRRSLRGPCQHLAASLISSPVRCPGARRRALALHLVRRAGRAHRRAGAERTRTVVLPLSASRRPLSAHASTPTPGGDDARGGRRRRRARRDPDRIRRGAGSGPARSPCRNRSAANRATNR